MNHRLDVLLSVIGLLLLVTRSPPRALSFCPTRTFIYNRHSCIDDTDSCGTRVGMFANEPSTNVVTNDLSNKGTTPSSSSTLLDRNNQIFVVGGTVRIIASSLRAHHVSAKGFGSFSESKTFIPAPELASRKDKCLILPVGLIGTIATVYDASDSDTSLPLQIKFTPRNSGEYDVPVAFTMHLDTSEVEVVH